MIWMLVSSCAGVGFLLGVAIGLNLYCMPQPYRFGFEVRDEHD